MASLLKVRKYFRDGNPKGLPLCAHCKINPVCHPGAKYCGAACSEEAEAGK